MKYTTLRSDIIGILHSADYGFELKMYDADGTSTLEAEEAQWIYLLYKNNDEKNILITLPSDMESVLTIWKESDKDGEQDKKYENDLKSIIQRIRELSILNGISVNVETFNILNRRKVYNLIKDAMAKRKDEMKESVSSNLSKALFELANTIRNTKRTSDKYVSESIAAKNKIALIENIKLGLSGIKSLNKKEISEFLDKALLENSSSSLNKILSKFKKEHLKEYKALRENYESIKNIGYFAKARYLENKEIERKPQTIMFLENVMVYPARTNLDKENLVKAYNHLLSISENAKSGTDIMIAIKKHKLCETYKVSKDDLLDMWLSKSVDEKIEPKTLIVFENASGEKSTFSLEIKPSIKLLAEHFNNNGSADDEITESIVNETIKLNRLTDLIENYSYNTSIKKYGSLIKKLFKECLNKLQTKSFESSKMIDYSKELALVESKVGFKHPALKYIAISEAQVREENNMQLTIERIKDERILREGLELNSDFSKAKENANSIIKNHIILGKAFKKDKDMIENAKNLYNNVYTADTKVQESLNECLFLMINNPTRTVKKKRFLETLQKYILK